MGYLWTTIHVKNMETSIKFYQEVVGLEVRRRFSLSPNSELVFLGVGETEIELMYNKGESLPGNYEGLSIGFSTDDANKLRDSLIENGVTVTDIESPNPSLQFFVAKDPDGVNVQFVEDLRKR